MILREKIGPDSTYDVEFVTLEECEQIVNKKGFNTDAPTVLHLPGYMMGRSSQQIRGFLDGNYG